MKYYEVAMTNYSQDKKKKQFRRQLTLPPHKQTLLRETSTEEKYFILFNRLHMKNRVLQITVFLRRNMLLKMSC